MSLARCMRYGRFVLVIAQLIVYVMTPSDQSGECSARQGEV